jgi:hypothetical protein
MNEPIFSVLNAKSPCANTCDVGQRYAYDDPNAPWYGQGDDYQGCINFLVGSGSTVEQAVAGCCFCENP